MKSIRVILAQLYSELQPNNAEPFSIEVLAGAAAKYASDSLVDLITINPSVDPKDVARFISMVEEGDYDLVGLSVPQGTFYLAIEILSLLENKTFFGGKPTVVLGHALPTYYPEAFLVKYPWVLTVRGWGEDAFLSLIRMLQEEELILEDVPGVAYVNNGHIIKNKIVNSIIPSEPRRIHLGRFFPRVETSRGCHYGKCTFCTRPPGRKDEWQRIPMEIILSSIEELKSSGVTYFTFADEDFIGNDLDGAMLLANGIAKISGMNFSISVRADNIFNPSASKFENERRLSTIKALQRAGLSMVFIGVESLSDSQLSRYGKGMSAANSVKSVRIIESLGIPVEIGFMLFDPFVTINEIEEVASTLMTTNVWKNVGNLFSDMRVQKDTPYESWLKKKGLINHFEVNLLAYEWSFQDKMAGKLAHACLSWGKPFHHILRLLRNLERTKNGLNISKRFSEKFRMLDLLVLGNLLENIYCKSSPEDILTPDKQFYKERFMLSSALLEELKNVSFLDDEDLTLRSELDLFTSSFHMST